MKNEINKIPRKVQCGGRELELRLMNEGDSQAVLAFADALSSHDLLFIERDIRNPKVVAAWLRQSERGTITTLLAVSGGTIQACVAVVQDQLSWSPHVGEIRAVVTPAMRGTGLGRLLIQEALTQAVGRGLTKLMARMTPDQRGAIAVFQDLGFRGEALLREHVKDAAGRKHDIIIFSLDVNHVEAQMEAYGYDEVF
jgi:RimJ/RimL family protein N-acetyltransferase